MRTAIYISSTCMFLLAGIAGCDGGGDGGGDDTDSETGTGSDTGTGTDTDVQLEDWIGEPCTEEDQECGELSGNNPAAFCHLVDGVRGFCTMECAPATTESPGVDPCGQEAVCGDFSWILPETSLVTSICVQTCVPTGGSNPCTADYLKCDPLAWSREKASATCLLEGCGGNDDCPVPVGTTCFDDEDCDQVGEEECVELDGKDQCVFLGKCSSKSGRCTHDGSQHSVVGDPCDTTYDCGDNMLCQTPATHVLTGSKVLYANGHCYKSGCSVVTPNNHGVGNQTMEIAVVDDFGCGTLGVCHQGYRGGQCFRRCDPAAAADHVLSCRQSTWDPVAFDAAGDYECYDQTVFIEPAYALGDPSVIGSPSTVTAPYCSWVGSEHRCVSGMAVPPNESMTCEDLFGRKDQGTDLWGLGMDCRELGTGASAQQGYCMDNTTSHWTGTWSESLPDAGGPDPLDGGVDASIDAG